MTTEEFITKLNRQIERIEKEDKPLEIAVRSVMSLQTKRIFQDGINSAGGQIGQYSSDKTLYVNTKIAAPLTQSPKGKTGKTKFKNGNQHKSTYFTSYKDFRDKQKRESGFVNLRLTNELQSDFANATVGKTSDSVARNPSAIKVTTHQYKVNLKKDINIKKKEGIEDKYGRVFGLTKEEKETFYRVARLELRKAMQL